MSPKGCIPFSQKTKGVRAWSPSEIWENKHITVFQAFRFLFERFQGTVSGWWALIYYHPTSSTFSCHPRFVIPIIFNFLNVFFGGAGVLDVCFSVYFRHKHWHPPTFLQQWTFRLQQKNILPGRWKKAWDLGKVIHNIWKTVGVKDSRGTLNKKVMSKSSTGGWSKVSVPQKYHVVFWGRLEPTWWFSDFLNV